MPLFATRCERVTKKHPARSAQPLHCHLRFPGRTPARGPSAAQLRNGVTQRRPTCSTRGRAAAGRAGQRAARSPGFQPAAVLPLPCDCDCNTGAGGTAHTCPTAAGLRASSRRPDPSGRTGSLPPAPRAGPPPISTLRRANAPPRGPGALGTRRAAVDQQPLPRAPAAPSTSSSPPPPHSRARQGNVQRRPSPPSP